MQFSRRRPHAVACFLSLACAVLTTQLGFVTFQRTAQRTRSARITAPLSRMRAAGVQEDLGPLIPVSKEQKAATDAVTSRLENVMLAGSNLWGKITSGGPVPHIYFIGPNGNNGDEIALSLLDAFAYKPSPDGKTWLQRSGGQDGCHEEMIIDWWYGDEVLCERAPKSHVDFFMEDEKGYGELEYEIIKEYSETEGKKNIPMGFLVSETAIRDERVQEIVKKGLVIWVDSAEDTAWFNTQSRDTGSNARRKRRSERPPVWAIANGIDGDVDDGESRQVYSGVFKENLKIYEELATVRTRGDSDAVKYNPSWGAERILKSLTEALGYAKDGSGAVGSQEEVLRDDLSKLLEGARLTKYLDQVITWCGEQGAVSIEELSENADDIAEATGMKPLEKKRLQKAMVALLESVS